MQHIQDNEFDQLFRDKFEEAEIKPSAHLWNHIETQLAVKPRRVFPVYWMAAAVAVAGLSAALLFKTAGAKRQLSDGIAVAQVSPSAAVARQAKPAASAEPVPRLAASPKVIAPGIQIEDSPAVDEPKKDLAALQPIALNARHDTKEIAVSQEKLPLPVSAEPIVLASNDVKPGPGDEVINENDNRAENKGIRNMGDLINYVVDKVDKSDEKIIQFKTDDDNSSLIALNIGIIRFNSKRHKQSEKD